MSAKVMLLLESDFDTRSALFDLLSSEGHFVFEADTCEIAEKILNSMPAIELVVSNLLVSDCKPDGMVVRRLRRARPNISIILASASPTLISIAKELEVPSIKKPFQVECLLAMLLK